MTDRNGVEAAEPSRLKNAFDAVPVPSGNATVRLLARNTEAWSARWHLLETAHTSIYANYFHLERDIFGFAFLGHLLKKARERCAVRLLTDAVADTFGQRGFKATFRGQDYLQELVEAGAAVGIYHPLYRRPWRILSWGWMASNHDKILVCDKARGITGGRNIGWDYYASPVDHPDAWRDSDILINDPGSAAAMIDAFKVEFDNKAVTHEIKKNLFGNWRPRDVELIGAYVLMDLWLKGETLDEEQRTRLRSDPKARSKMADELVASAIARIANEPIESQPSKRERKRLRGWAYDLTGFPATHGSLASFVPGERLHDAVVKVLDRTSSAGTERDQISKALIELAFQAKKRILIENPYVVLTELMVEALEAVSSNGVEIQIGTNSPLSTDSSATQAFFLEDWPSILARVPTLRLFVATGERKFHAKVGVIDDVLTVISTYNLDFLSAHVNSEIVAAVWSESLAAETVRSFVEDRNDPANGVLEWTILRDESGAPVLENGKPVVNFGPEHHLSKSLLRSYRRMRWLANVWRKLPWFAPLRHPPLTEVLGIYDK